MCLGSRSLIAFSDKHFKKEVTGIGFVTSQHTFYHHFDDWMPVGRHPGRSGLPSGWQPIASGQRKGALIGCRRGRGLGVVDEGVNGVEFVLFWPLWQWRLCFTESVERE